MIGIPKSVLVKNVEGGDFYEETYGFCGAIAHYDALFVSTSSRDASHHSQEIKDQFEELEGKDVSIAGRMMSKRVMVSATLTLYQGSTCVTSWSGSGNGRVIISKSCTVKSGMEYKLVLSYSVNGKAQESVSVTAISPK